MAFLPLILAETGRPSAWDILAGTLAGLADSGALSLTQPRAEIVAWSALHGLAELKRSGALLPAPVKQDSAVIEDRVLDSSP